jgi:hypothetical protein
MTDTGSARDSDFDNRQIESMEFDGGMKSLKLSVMLRLASIWLRYGFDMASI